jgi:hypothetical protein
MHIHALYLVTASHEILAWVRGSRKTQNESVSIHGTYNKTKMKPLMVSQTKHFVMDLDPKITSATQSQASEVIQENVYGIIRPLRTDSAHPIGEDGARYRLQREWVSE